jgi:hypothetical protein
MKLPYATQARVERKKIIEYLLSSSHPDGSAKARFFARFGFSEGEWRTLARALRQHARVHGVSGSIESKYGRRYSVDGSLETPDRRNPRIRTVWVLTKRSKSPRLVTAYPIEE